MFIYIIIIINVIIIINCLLLSYDINNPMVFLVCSLGTKFRLILTTYMGQRTFCMLQENVKLLLSLLSVVFESLK